MKRIPVYSPTRRASLPSTHQSTVALHEYPRQGSAPARSLSTSHASFPERLPTTKLPPIFLCPRLDRDRTFRSLSTASICRTQAPEEAARPVPSAERKQEPWRAAYRATQLALHSGDALKLLYSLLRGVKEPGFLRAHPPAQVASICRALDFEELAEPYKRAHDGAERLHRIASVSKHVEEYRARLRRGAGIVLEMMQYWRKARNTRFTLQEYNRLLAAANEFGDDGIARLLFRNMQADRITPDLTSYNHYFEVHCYTHSNYALSASSPSQSSQDIGHPGIFLSSKEKVRFLGAQLRLGESPHIFGSIEERSRQNRELMGLFREMTLQNVAPNADTLCFLALSFGRSGNLDGVKQVLNDIWSIDVDSALAEDKSGLLKKPTLSKGSPLYPNARLLFALAHVFRRDQPLAVPLRIVQHVAQAYDLNIDKRTWKELLRAGLLHEKAHIISAASIKPDSGPVQPSAVDLIWNAMHARPHSIQPDLTMYRILLASLYLRGLPLRLHETLRQTQDLIYKETTEAFRAVNRFGGGVDMEIFEKASRERALAGEHTPREMSASAALHRRRYVTQWLLLLLDPSSWPVGTMSIPNFTEKFVPRVLSFFRFFHPLKGMGYDTESGRVDFLVAWRLHQHFFRVKVMPDRASGHRIVQMEVQMSPADKELPSILETLRG